MAERESSGHGIALRSIEIKVIPNAKRKSVVHNEGGQWRVYCSVPAQDGRANREVIAILADYFKVKKSAIEIIKGLKSRNKTISINRI